jgi:hypothetical protein
MAFGNSSPIRQRGLIVLLACCLLGLFAVDLLAAGKPGIVTTKRNDKYLGDVDTTSVPGSVIITDAGGHRIQLNQLNVSDIKYFANLREEFDARLANLGPKDVAGRVALARWALAKNDVDLAVAASHSAKAIDATNPDVVTLDRQIAAVRPPPPAATTPATPPAATTPAVAAVGPAKRMLTAEEITTVRLREMQDNDRGIKLQITPPVKKAAFEAGLLTAEENRFMQLPDVAMKILKDPTAPVGLKKQVKITGDPTSLNDFRQKINKPLVAGCAAAACHGDNTKTNFRLFSPPEKEEAALTNFVILNKYVKTTDGIERSMINRTQPLASLLLGYIMPPDLARVPHPAVPGYKGLVKTAQDPPFVMALDWMGKTLIPGPVTYDDIDLMAPAPAPKPGDVAPAEPPKTGTVPKRTGK